MVKACKYVLRKYFQGVSNRDDFEVVETELPAVQNGEILVKTEWVSVDPFQRAYNYRLSINDDQIGFQVGIVEESKDVKYPVGSRIVSNNGWCDYYIVNIGESKFDTFNFKAYKLNKYL